MGKTRTIETIIIIVIIIISLSFIYIVRKNMLRSPVGTEQPVIEIEINIIESNNQQFSIFIPTIIDKDNNSIISQNDEIGKTNIIQYSINLTNYGPSLWIKGNGNASLSFKKEIEKVSLLKLSSRNESKPDESIPRGDDECLKHCDNYPCNAFRWYYLFLNYTGNESITVNLSYHIHDAWHHKECTSIVGYLAEGWNEVQARYARPAAD